MLQNIDVSENKLGDKGILVIAACLAFRNIKNLNVSSCEFTLEGGYSLLTAIAKSAFLITVKLDKNHLIGDRLKMRAFKDIFSLNKSLVSISLNECYIGYLGATNICWGLGLSAKLKSVSLAKNGFGDDGAIEFVNAFSRPTCSIEHFNLASNKITDKGGKFLSQAFSMNETLKQLDLRQNFFTDNVAAILLKACKSNEDLTQILLDGNVV